MEQTRKFTFNSGITGVDELGKFHSDLHDKAIMPLRGKIMQLDGMTGCHIARYGVEVKYLPQVVTDVEVAAHVGQVFTDAARQAGFFQSLGASGKELEVICDWKTDQPETTTKWVYINFHANLIRFPALNSTTPFDQAAFDNATRDLVQKSLVDHDGVLWWNLGLRHAGVQIDTLRTSVEEIKEHLLEVFTEAAAGDDFFPYYDLDRVPDFTFVVKDA